MDEPPAYGVLSMSLASNGNWMCPKVRIEWRRVVILYYYVGCLLVLDHLLDAEYVSITSERKVRSEKETAAEDGQSERRTSLRCKQLLQLLQWSERQSRILCFSPNVAWARRLSGPLELSASPVGVVVFFMSIVPLRRLTNIFLWQLPVVRFRVFAIICFFSFFYALSKR